MRNLALIAIGAMLASSVHGSALAVIDMQGDDEEVSTVITPTRLRQSLQEVPASITVMTGDTLRRYGITSVPEALRLVPGMVVTRTTGSSYIVNYHGTNPRSSRRMNVLVDGVSIYEPGLSEIDWAQFPVAIEDIERIEVTRSPNSATYGPNSMLATINILTKDSKDTPTAEVVAGGGSNQTRHAYARFSKTAGRTAIYLSMSHDGDDGYGKICERTSDG